ncbi:MAG TPA: SGNH/GDSL hydrolase family protein [Dyella sp.]|uniref:SGNH/GDSL hydrolase family protein n=1 Tax=Dyella sp. TaxID=1869338 RepID=UPI002C4EE3B7|nr:SGNH/GDSL hydrolase family protein [Dyella sp.]HTV85835.1 SGNH/GDSL hydrolase family protein [Dyella sp.]
MVLLTGAALSSSFARAADSERWVAAWTTSLQAIPQLSHPPPLYRAPDVSGRTLRQIVYPTLDGNMLRIRISNRYAREPLRILAVKIAASARGTAATDGESVAVTFAGASRATLAPDADIESDAVHLPVHRGKPYAVSIYLGQGQHLQAWHRVASQFNYLSSPGDHTQDSSAAAFRSRITQWAWLATVSVASPSARSILAIGDSITDGMASSLGMNHRWPDDLARRVAKEGYGPVAVLNAGISGNRLLSDSPCYGESLSSRFERTLADTPGVQSVVVLIGINDINFAHMPPRRVLDCDAPHTLVSVSSLIAGYQALAATAHRHHVRLFIGTLTPASLPAEREAIRAGVNRWIRAGRGFDGVIDFDAALRDPAQPQRLRTVYDSGDHIHPSDAGYAAMAQAVPWRTVLEASPR